MTLEILISTMFRENLDFLEPIFVNNNIEDFNIIIVNQTDENKVLKSEFNNIKIINSYERGSPDSRNLAIENSSHDICLMADDDMVYQPNLKQTIIEAYQNNTNADMISFEAIDENNNLYANYPLERFHDIKTLKSVCTLVITFKSSVFKTNAIYFNHYFGVGSVFKGETEYVFLRNAFDKNLKMYHVAKTIVMHPYESSGRLMGSDNSFFARSALTHRFYGNLSYFWLLKYVLYMWKDGYITFNEIPRKFKIGLQGISKYKALKASGEIDKLYAN